jgi:hypothetical protein
MTYAQKKQIISAMQRLVPPHSEEPQDPDVLAKLTALTNDLIRVYQSSGRLREHPYEEAASRRIHLYADQIAQAVKDKVIIVTGGEGCVGQSLLEPLVNLGAKRIVSLDKARLPETEIITDGKIVYYPLDIRDRSALEQVFATERPQLVFHLAAQRLPGLAEVQIRETISSNLFGTCNTIELCERYGVEKCIFSSTGKASRYYTADVYAASKKICEWLFAQAAQTGKTIYAAVRFTHILDNSSIEMKIDSAVESGIVNLHKPDIDLLPQNVSEANHLLLNGLVEAVPQKLKLLLVRDLGWPIDLLELPLYKIVQAGKKIPLYFNGLQAGYDEPFFHGQFDPSLGTEVNPLINAIEDVYRGYDRSGTMVVTEMPEFDFDELNRQVAVLTQLAADPNFPETQLKAIQAKAVKAIASSLVAKVKPDQILRILQLGVNPKLFAAQRLEVNVHEEVIGIFMHGLHGRLEQIENLAADEYAGLPGVIEQLRLIPELATSAAYLESAYQKALQGSRQLTTIAA